jgi:hypothetical protein
MNWDCLLQGDRAKNVQILACILCVCMCVGVCVCVSCGRVCVCVCNSHRTRFGMKQTWTYACGRRISNNGLTETIGHVPLITLFLIWSPFCVLFLLLLYSPSFFSCSLSLCISRILFFFLHLLSIFPCPLFLCSQSLLWT